MGIHHRPLLPEMKPGRLLRLASAACLLAAACSIGTAQLPLSLAGELGAELTDAEGVTWWRYDPKTGKKTWEVSTKKATPSADGKTCLIAEPKMLIRGSEYDVNVSSDTGTMTREDEKNNAFKLAGNVLVKMADPYKTVLTTDAIEWVPSTRTLQSGSPVEVKRTDLAVSGVGLEIEPENQGKGMRLVRLKKNVKATITPAASKSALFPAIGGTADKLPKDDAPMVIVCQGPMAINRDSSTVSFTDKVEVRRGTFSINCNYLELTLDPNTKKVPDTKQVKEIRCTGDVNAFDGANGASGDTLSWDALSGLAEVTGSKDRPAKTWRGSASVTAPIIWISQKDRRVLWSGRAHLFAPAEGAGKLFRFGGGN